MVSVVDIIHQSPPVDPTAEYDSYRVAGKTILITGGASGFGAAFARHWAARGAHLIIGDVNDAAGEALVAELRQTSKSEHHLYQHCDVTDWASQVSLFRAGARASPHGGIDAVVANAGTKDSFLDFDIPQGNLAEDANPPAPDLKCLDVNITGVMYTTHLACYWLPRNPGSPSELGQAPEVPNRDRHLMLIGSVGGMSPLPIQPQYTVTKHAVLGLFRSLIGVGWRQGIRVNMLCPYFIDTPILPPTAHVFLAGGAMGEIEDVVEAGTRLMADTSIVARALAICKRVRVEGLTGGQEFKVVGVDDGKGPKPTEGEPLSIWDCTANDYEAAELFTSRYIRMLHTILQIRGWTGWAKDVAGALGKRWAQKKAPVNQNPRS